MVESLTYSARNTVPRLKEIFWGRRAKYLPFKPAEQRELPTQRHKKELLNVHSRHHFNNYHYHQHHALIIVNKVSSFNLEFTKQEHLFWYFVLK